MKSPFQKFVPCQVCTHPTSSFHYGAWTCEACKAFFRRILKGEVSLDDLQCLTDLQPKQTSGSSCTEIPIYNGLCDIRTTPKKCPKCRYKLCLSVGMSREASKMGRPPKQKKSPQQHCQSAFKIVSTKINPVEVMTVQQPQLESNNSNIELDQQHPIDVIARLPLKLEVKRRSRLIEQSTTAASETAAKTVIMKNPEIMEQDPVVYSAATAMSTCSTTSTTSETPPSATAESVISEDRLEGPNATETAFQLAETMALQDPMLLLAHLQNYLMQYHSSDDRNDAEAAALRYTASLMQAFMLSIGNGYNAGGIY